MQIVNAVNRHPFEQSWDDYSVWWSSEAGLSKQHRHLGDEWGDDALVDSYINSFVLPYINRESKLLEIGPGGGRYTARVVDHCSQLVGVDVSTLMVERVRGRFREKGQHVFLKGNGHDLATVADDSQDFVFAFNVFIQLEFEDLVSYLGEIKRVLKPGGRMSLHYATISHRDGWDHCLMNCRAWANHPKPRSRFCELTTDTMALLAERFSLRLLANRPVARDAMVVLEKRRLQVALPNDIAMWEPQRTTVSYPILFPKGTSFFFLVGNMRSGTTWLMDLLNTHPDFRCGGEMHAVERPDCSFPTLESVSRNAASLRQWYLSPNNGWSSPFQTGPHQPQLEDDFVRFFFEWTLYRYLQSQGIPTPRFIGDKSPTHTRSLVRRLRMYFGIYEPFVLHLVRDPRDTAVSRWFQMRKRQNLGQFDFAEGFRCKEDEIACASLMADPEKHVESNDFFCYPDFLPSVFDEWMDVNSGLVRDGKAAFGERYLMVKYEDMKADLPGTLQQIFRWFGASGADSVIAEIMDRNDVTKMVEKKETYRKGLTGEWAKYFNEDDTALFNERVRSVSKTFGYE
jgi:SAM-dependent methyltransferase